MIINNICNNCGKNPKKKRRLLEWGIGKIKEQAINLDFLEFKKKLRFNV